MEGLSSGRVACLATITAALLAFALPQVAAAGELGFSYTPSKTEPYAVCGRPTAGHSACTAILVPTAAARSLTLSRQMASPSLASPTYPGSGVGGGYDPADLRSAYNLPSESAGSGQTVAIVDAYDDPNAESDLGVYRSRYGLTACTTADGCFKKVNQIGETKNYPAPEAGWAVEISLDIDMVSAACPNCHILLVEATSATDENLYAAEDEAVTLGATEVSNSYESTEESGETSSDKYFDHPGVPIFAAAGDSGYGVRYPAASQYVIAVGGTALKQASNSRGWSETVWKGTGSGCSAYEAKPTWQTASPSCAKRTNNDIAAVASPATPVSLADSYKVPAEFEKPEPGWTLAGGTSVSSPLMAGTMALANAHTRSFAGADAYYLEASQNGTGVLTDITSGSNGSCGNYLCNGEVGYDGPTGLGSPYGAPIVLEAPTVVTKAASSAAQTTASLNATVNPNGGEVSKCEFEYGTTISYGSTASCSSLPGSGASPVAVSAALSGLTANTTYHFRIQATNAGGTSKGSDETFKTLANVNPPTVVTASASAVGSGSATLGATVNPNGAEVSECKLEYGTTESYGQSASCTPAPGAGSSAVSVSAAITGLAANSTYHFRISATNSSGTSKGSGQTLMTLFPPHWYSEGSSIPEGARMQVIQWGNLTLTGSKEISCHIAIGGSIENPTTGGNGIGSSETFAAWDCVANYSCPAGASPGVEPQDLPWSNTLEEIAGKVRDKTLGEKVIVGCVIAPEDHVSGTAFIIGKQKDEPQAPNGLNKGTGARHPGLFEFDTGSGHLEAEGSEGATLGSTEGQLRILGFEEQEHIYAEKT